MPILYRKGYPEGFYLQIWTIKESIEEIIELQPAWARQISEIPHPAKKLEFLHGQLAVLHLCKWLKIPFESWVKDKNGKPQIRSSDWEVSISHTTDYVGIVAQKHKPIGIDIEKPREKLQQVNSRIHKADELDLIDQNEDTATIFWSAKEALYKLYGQRKVDFKKNLTLFYKDKSLYGEIKMSNYSNIHPIKTIQLGVYFLVIAY